MTRHQYGISVLASRQTSFRGVSSGGVAKCRLLSQADSTTDVIWIHTHLWVISIVLWKTATLSYCLISSLRKQPTFGDATTDVWETSAEILYWWRVITQIWVVLLIGRAAWEIWLASPNVGCFLRLFHFLITCWSFKRGAKNWFLYKAFYKWHLLNSMTDDLMFRSKTKGPRTLYGNYPQEFTKNNLVLFKDDHRCGHLGNATTV